MDVLGPYHSQDLMSPYDVANALNKLNGQISGGGGSITVSGNASLTVAQYKLAILGANPPDVIMSVGYDTPGDFGQAMYKRINTLPAAPFTNIGTWTSLDGWHYLMIPTSDDVWVSAFGAKPRAYNDFSFDNYQFFEDCKYWILSQPNTIAPLGNHIAFTMRAPPGGFYFSKPHSIEGGAYHLRGSGRNTILRSALNQDCIQVQKMMSPGQVTIGHEGSAISTDFDTAVGGWFYWPGGTRIYNCTVAGRPTGTEPTGTGTGIVNGTATFDYVRDLTWSELQQTTGDYAKISHLTVFGRWDRGADPSTDDEDQTVSGGAYHSGILLRGRAEVEDVATYGFPGYGIAVISSDATIRGAGNADDSYLHRIASYYNGHAGIRLGTFNANACTLVDIDTAFNRDWGIDDAAFLTTTVVGAQSAHDGSFVGLARYNTFVVHNGYLWLAKVADTGIAPDPNYHNEPGIDDNSWIRWAGDGTLTSASTGYPDWDNTTRFQPCGAFRSDNFNNRASWKGVYIEGDTPPAQWAKRTLVWGGILGGNYDTSRGAIIHDDLGYSNAMISRSIYNNASGQRPFHTQFGNFSQNGSLADSFVQNVIVNQNAEGSGFTLGTLPPPSASVTGQIADVNFSGTIIPRLAVTAVASGIFNIGATVTGAGVPAHTHIARQINPTTGATIAWVGGIGSYALDRGGATIGSEAMTLVPDGTSNVDYWITNEVGAPVLGWTGRQSAMVAGRNAGQPNVAIAPNGVLLGGASGTTWLRRLFTTTGAPSPGDYADGDVAINIWATSSGDGTLYFYCKTGPHAGNWMKIASIP